MSAQNQFQHFSPTDGLKADRRISTKIAYQDQSFVCRPVLTEAEFKEAFALVYDEYERRGYCQPHKSQIHFNYHLFIPGTKTFIIKDRTQLLGTISLFVDSPCGLPMESAFSSDVAKVRQAMKGSIAEVGLLALKTEAIDSKRFALTNTQKLHALFCLFKTMLDHARFTASVSDLVISVHPKHESLYRHLYFQMIGDVRAYPAACQKPGMPMHVDIERAAESPAGKRAPGTYLFNVDELPAPLHENQAWRISAFQTFLLSRPDLFLSMPQIHREYLGQHYPELARFSASKEA